MGVFQGGRDLGLHLGAGAPIEIEDEGVFGRIVIVRCAGGDPRFLRDVPHSRAVKSFLTKERERGVQDFEAGLFGFGGRTRNRFERVQEPVCA